MACPEAERWLRAQLPGRDVIVEVARERAWGDVWRVTVDGRLHWFKLPHPSMAREVALRRVLEERAPDLILPLMLGEEEHGWQLTADQGPTLAAQAIGPGASTVHVALARALAGVQRAVPAADLTRIGLDRFAPSEVEATLDEELAWFAALPADHPLHVDAGARRRAEAAMAPLVRRWQGVRNVVPDLGIDHNDLHPGNAFPGPLISDWGDAVLGHPFGSLRVLLHAAVAASGEEGGARVRAAYLDAWGLPDADEALDLAMMLSVPQRLHCWARLDDADTVAAYAAHVRPLIDEIGTPAERLSSP